MFYVEVGEQVASLDFLPTSEDARLCLAATEHARAEHPGWGQPRRFTCSRRQLWRLGGLPFKARCQGCWSLELLMTVVLVEGMQSPQ